MADEDKEKKEEEAKKEVTGPSSGIVGEAGGSQMPRLAEGLVYNPETIPLTTFIQMEDDAQVKAVLTIVKSPLMNVMWSINSESAEIRDFCYASLRKVWGTLIRDMLNAINFGFQAFEKVFLKSEGKWILDEFLDLYPPSVTIKKDPANFKFAGIKQQTTKGGVMIPVEKSFVFTIDKRFGNLYGRSRLRSAYMYWFIDKYTYDFENVYFERFTQPILSGEAPSGYTQTGGTTAAPTLSENLNLLLEKLTSLKQAGAIVLPSDVDPISKQKKWGVKFLESSKTGASFESRHKHLDQMKARAIFAPELVFSSPYAGSSYALAREHATIFIGAEEAILEDIKTHIDKYILRDLVRWNFGQKAAPAEWIYESISTETKNLVRDLVIAMVQGDMIRPDADWLAKTMHLKLRERAEETIEKKEVEKETEEISQVEQEAALKKEAEVREKMTEEARIKEETARKETEKLLKQALLPRIRPPTVSPGLPPFRSAKAYERAGARPKPKVRRVGPRIRR